MEDHRRAICNDCGQTHESPQLKDIPAGYVSWIEENNPAGHPEPVGLCPNCDSECYWVEDLEEYEPPEETDEHYVYTGETQPELPEESGEPRPEPSTPSSLDDLPPVLGENGG